MLILAEDQIEKSNEREIPVFPEGSFVTDGLIHGKVRNSCVMVDGEPRVMVKMFCTKELIDLCPFTLEATTAAEIKEKLNANSSVKLY